MEFFESAGTGETVPVGKGPRTSSKGKTRGLLITGRVEEIVVKFHGIWYSLRPAGQPGRPFELHPENQERSQYPDIKLETRNQNLVCYYSFDVNTMSNNYIFPLWVGD